MNPFALARRWPAIASSSLLVVLFTGIAGCGGSSATDATSPPAPTTIGAAGGTVTSTGGSANAAGAKVEIPPGALGADTAISVEESGIGAPALPAGITPFGPVFELTPHGTSFTTPATLTLPLAASPLPAGTRLALYKTSAGQTAWEPVANATVSGATIVALISSFSFVQPVAQPLPQGDPAPGCDLGVRMNMNITGKVLDPRGQPHVGHVVLRDRTIEAGAIVGEASANEAGFFLLAGRGIVTSAGCPRSYVIEVDSRTAEGVGLFGELDVTSLFPAGATGLVEEDITATPVILAEVE